jgi:predicted dehydrogenase
MKRLVVIGPGLMGQKHIELIDGNPRCTLVGIVCPEQDQHHLLDDRHRALAFGDLETCLAKTGPSGAIISSPNMFHYEQARQCILADIPVLIEKPITTDVNEAENLVDLVRSRQAKAIVGHHRAHSPLLRTARQVIQDGVLGKLIGVQGSAVFYKPSEYFAAGPWRTVAGGGPILINLIHEIGIMRSLCGEISGVHALSSRHMRRFDVEDTVVINLAFESGALGNFLLSDVAASARSWEQTSQENPIYPTYSDEDCYHLAGTRGSLAIPTMRLKYAPEGQEPSWTRPMVEQTLSVQRIDPLTAQLDNFLDVIEGTAEPVISAFDGLQSLRVIEAIQQSAQSQTMVWLND